MNGSISTKSTIHKAVIPAAGLGSRLRPLTNAIPKEMLPLGRYPVLHYIIKELRDADVTDICFIISPTKDVIRNYFGDGSAYGVQARYIYQTEMKGLGDAISLAEVWTCGEDFVVAFGDCVLEFPASNPLKRLMETHTNENSSATVLTQVIPLSLSSKYGIVKPVREVSPKCPVQMADLIEKPDPKDAPSNRAVAARWILSNRIFESLRSAPLQSNGELNLTDAVRQLITSGLPCWSTPLLVGENRLDIGGWKSYLAASARYAVNDKEFGSEISKEVIGGVV